MSWPPDPQAIGKRVEELDTPCLVLDLDMVERNLGMMARAFAGTAVKVRPHAKTHKSPNLALMQLQHGAIGICCAKLGEAEVMAAGGVSGLLITSEIVGPAKVRRLLGLAQQARVITVVDDADAATSISEAALAAGLRLPCLVDIDVGTHRTGVAAGEPALELAVQVAAMKGLQLVGVQGYEGHAQHIAGAPERRQAHVTAMQLLTQTAELLLDHGLPIEIVSTAGTGTCHFATQWERVTEVQPGSYVMMDTHYRGVEGLDFETALTVLTSVISRRHDAAIVDAGLKSISSDAGPAGPRDLEAHYRPFGEEHGLLAFDHGNPLGLGDKIALIPSHCDTTINLHDLYYVCRGERIVAVWPVAARGRVQ